MDSVWRYVERHQLKRKIVAAFDHRKHDRAVTTDHALAAKAINNQRFMGPRFAV
jgi:hypothetical protein